MGAATRDILPADPRGWRLGGGVTYGALAAARLGFPVRALVGVDEQAATAAELELLRAAGVELELVQLGRGPVMENRERPTGRLQLAVQASDDLSPEALSARWSQAQAVLLAPVAGELGPAWAEAVSPTAIVGLAWQGLLRRLLAGRPVRPLRLAAGPLIARADLALVSAGDLSAGGGPPLSRLLARSGQRLVVTHGRRGALHLRRSARGIGARFVPPLRIEREVDATGAGDVFLAAWWAATACLPAAAERDQWRPLALAAVVAGLSVEGSGVGALPDARTVARRLRA